MKYICDICGKTYENLVNAESCEANCKEKLEKKKELDRKKDERLDEIKELIKSYNEDYNADYYLDLEAVKYNDTYLEDLITLVRNMCGD